MRKIPFIKLNNGVISVGIVCVLEPVKLLYLSPFSKTLSLFSFSPILDALLLKPYPSLLISFRRNIMESFVNLYNFRSNKNQMKKTRGIVCLSTEDLWSLAQCILICLRYPDKSSKKILSMINYYLDIIFYKFINGALFCLLFTF